MLPSAAVLSVVAFYLRQISAQSVSDVPQCDQQATASSIGSIGCQITDIECICKNQGFINGLLPVVEKACSPEDLQKTISFTESLCDGVGVTLTVSTSVPSITATAGSNTNSVSANQSSMISTTQSVVAPASTTGASASSAAITKVSSSSNAGSMPTSELQRSLIGTLCILTALVFYY